MSPAHNIWFPRDDSSNLGQDEAFFYIELDGEEKTLRFHDYDQIYSIPGLYEQLFYGRLKCQSPTKVTEILHTAMRQTEDTFSALRVLDLGAGNGMMGEAMRQIGVSRMVGVDIVPEAKTACMRDRAGVYDGYYIEDFTSLDKAKKDEIGSWGFDCMTTVASLGFGDIPTKAFLTAFNLTAETGWIAFNIKESFFGKADTSGFSTMIRKLIFSQYLDIYCIERYRHRLSIDGAPIYYYAIAGRKTADAPMDYADV